MFLDVRGGTYSISHCQHRRIREFEGRNPATASWLEVDAAFEPLSLLGLNLKIVKPPWQWNTTEGYFGGKANGGWADSAEPGARGLAGDSTSGEIAESCGFESGGRWKRLPDLPHLQNIYGLTLAEIKEIYRTGRGIKAIWAELKAAQPDASPDSESH